MERFGSFEEEGFKFEAFHARDKEGRYVWKIIVTRNGVEVRKETLEMEHFTDPKTGEVEWINNPNDMANIAIMEKRSAEILQELLIFEGSEQEAEALRRVEAEL